MTEPAAKPKLGEILVKSGAISLKELENFLQQQEELKDERGYQTKLGTLLLEHNLVTEETLALAFAAQHGIEYEALNSFKPDLSILEKIPFSILSGFCFVPLYMDSQRLVISLHDPIDSFLFDLLYKALGLHIDYRSSVRSKVVEAHQKCLKTAKDTGRINNDFAINLDEYRLILQQEKRKGELPIRQEVSLKNTLDAYGLEDILLDISLNHEFDALHFRVLNGHCICLGQKQDQWLYYGSMTLETLCAYVLKCKSFTEYKDSEICVMVQSYMHLPLGESDFRNYLVTFLPGTYGTELLLEEFNELSTHARNLSSLGLLSQDLEKISGFDFSRQGALILSSQTNGKTSFLHACLKSLKQSDLTVLFEDKPTKSSHLTHLLMDKNRQMLQNLASLPQSLFSAVALDGIHLQELPGYLRILQPKSILAACNGQSVFPTLMAIEKSGESLGFLLEKMHFVIALKLVPSLCPYCIQPHRITPEELAKMGIKPETMKKPFFYYSGGCDYCEQKGYHDFTLIYEILYLSPAVLRLLEENPLNNEIAMHLLKSGALISMNNVAKDKLYTGKISIHTYLQILQKKI